MRIISWNVNGIRAAEKKGFIDWMKTENPDIVCIQETKAQREQLSEKLLNINGYTSYFESAERKGYSGVAIYTKHEPKSITNLGVAEYDDEGRVIIAEYDDFFLVNCYFPNSQEKGKRINYKIGFCDAILEHCNKLVAEGKNIVLTGDYNIAHTEIDLARPKQNEDNPGYLPAEREWMTKFLSNGYIDTFRTLHPEEIKYSWWSYRAGARARNVGWRIDYFCVNESFKENVKAAEILNEVMGSDHCPVVIEI
jgi:exodeoxyribonuclease-3